MYLSFFGLQQEPFSIAPDPSFLYMSEKHREALDLLGYGLTRGASFVLLTGEIGAGKTTVWRRFLEELPSNFDVANVVNPKLDTQALLARVCEDLHFETPGDARPIDLIDALHGHLLLAHARGRRTLIVIDEAQALSNEVLEQLRLLTNLDSSGRKLQVMLIGQPELRQILQQPQLEPLAQRVVARYHLPALSESETGGYIAHRLAVAGLRGPLPFDGESLALIHRLCRGVPRRINVICDRALANAQAAGQRRVDRHAVERAVAEAYGDRAGAAAISMATPAPAASASAIGGWGVTVIAGAALVAGILVAPRLGDPTGERIGSAGAETTAATAPAATGASSSAAVLATAEPAGSAAVETPAVSTPTTLAPPAATAPTTASTAVASAAATTSTMATPLAAATAASAVTTVLSAAFTAPSNDESAAWRTLAERWGARLGPGDPCLAAAAQSLRCLRSTGGLAEIRQLDRPGIVRLVDGRGRVGHAVLTGVGPDQAVLDVNGADVAVPLPELARVWRGDFATLWRTPPGYRDGELGSAALAWLAQQLAASDGQGPLPAGRDVLRARIAAFQLAHGLTPDGLAGPLTLLQLGRASGIDEPRLAQPARP